MATFVGKYKFDRNENLDDYIKKMGKLFMKILASLLINPVF